MKIPRKYKSELIEDIIKVTSRQDRLGNIFYLVEYSDPDSEYMRNAAFEKMESVFDFLKNNFLYDPNALHKVRRYD